MTRPVRHLDLRSATRPLPPEAPEAPAVVGEPLCEALVAFELLIQRYAGETEFRLHVTLADGAANAVAELTVSLEATPTVAALLDEAHRSLTPLLLANANAPGTVRFSWSAGDEPPDKALAVEVELQPRPGRVRLVPAADEVASILGPRAAAHWEMLLSHVARGEAARWHELSLFSPGERDRVLEGWSSGEHAPELCADSLLHELFEQQADARADGVAVECEGRHLTYRELERRANQLAHLLRARGIGHGDRVAMALPRSAEVYVTLLGILKSGAAYVPLDPSTPPERAAGIIADAGAPLLVTSSALANRFLACAPACVVLDADAEELARQPATRLTRAQTGAGPTDTCYVIFTSGSTGKPKGVEVEHRQVCHLVRAEGRLFAVTANDRVFQAFSIAFDASVEEVWLAFFAGATLVVGTTEMLQAGPGLSEILTHAQVTVLSCAPTLLSMMEADVPSVRLLILGGEACPGHLVQRWARAGRRFVNSYGPTEATVIATFADCAPDRPVTIGRPLPNYRAYVLDRWLQPVPVGMPGELCLGGAGIARGYIGRPDLTAERFVPNPFHAPDAPRLYRTGDLVRFAPDGELEFLGRIDAQVKIRGYRVELAEIESSLLQHEAVQAAAVTVRTERGQQRLVGYVVPRLGRVLQEESLRAGLQARLPAYMVPSHFELVDALPTLPSGKVDRKRLPEPKSRPAAQTLRPAARPSTPHEATLLAIWEEMFQPARVGLDDDFFLTFGGHSLLAASLATMLRRQPRFRRVSVADIYRHPTVRLLAARLDELELPAPGAAASTTGTSTLKPIRHRAATGVLAGMSVQTVALYFVFALSSVQWLGPYLTYNRLLDAKVGSLTALLVALAVMLGTYPAMLLLSVAVKWVVIGRFRAGVYPVWSAYYVRWWFVNRVLAIAPLDFLNGTPLLNLYYRLLGARIGSDVYIRTDNVRSFDLISIGDGTSIGADACVLGYSVEGGWLRIGPVDIGRNCFIGARSFVGEHVRMADGARLYDLSMLPPGTSMPAAETWLGSPALRVDGEELHEPLETLPRSRSRRAQRFFFGLLHATSSFALPLAILLAALPSILLMRWAAVAYGNWYLLSAPLAGTLFVSLLALEIVALKWLLVGRVRPGHYPLVSLFYWRKWLIDQLMSLSLDVLGPMYATLFLAPWYRALGATLGRHAEISTAANASPDLLTLGDDTFIADGVSLGAARVESGYVTLAPTQIRKGAFIGNSAVIPAGMTVGENALVGVLSLPPLEPGAAGAPDRTWLGSPAMFLPHRQKSAGFDEHTTFKPTGGLYLLRGSIEFFRVTVPSSLYFLLTAVLLDAASALAQATSLSTLVAVFPLLYVAFASAATLLVVLAKWALMGRYRPGEKPLWCTFVWLNEFVTSLHENVADPLLVSHLLGTPYVAWFLRALGAKVGARAYIETTQFTEYDLVRVGSDVSLNAECTIQTHLFEDRVMKMSHVDIEDGCTVGASTVVLYDTRMEAGASLGAVSLLMKGESLPADTRWAGAPARPTETPPAHLETRARAA